MSSDALYLIAGLVIGAMAGLVIGWSLSRNRALPTNKVLEDELRQQISTRDTDLSALRSQLIEAKSSAAESQAQRAAAAKRLEEAQAICKNAEDKCEELRQKSAVTAQEFATAIAQLDAEKTARAQLFEEKVQLAASSQEFQTASLAQKQQIGKLEAERRFLTESLETERKQIQSLQEKFQKDFQAIANKLLIENSKTFDEKSSENLDKLLGPLRETFLDFKNRLDSVHRQNLEQGTLLKDQISRIGTEAANLTKALKGDAKVLGNWGENMLDQILEKSGLQSGIHYRRQSGVRGENGEQRILDVVIELPDGKHLVIDSKVSLRCYEDYSNCVDDSLRKTHLESHVACLRAHFRGLGEKGYHEIHEISTPDFVLMYIPIEPAFFSAVAADSSLFSEALEKNVVLITNSRTGSKAFQNIAR